MMNQTTEPETTELALRPSLPPFSIVPRTFDEALKFAEIMSRSSLVPKDFKGKPEDCFLAVQMGLEVGLSPMQAMQNIAVINGRPTVWGDAMLALVQVSPVYEDHSEFHEGAGETLVAVCKVKRRGQAWHEERFSVVDAKQAGLWNKEGPWRGYPRRMLQMRARGFALRNKFPDVLKGLQMREEAEDLEGTVVAVDDVPREPQRIQSPMAASAGKAPEPATTAEAKPTNGETGENHQPPTAQTSTTETNRGLTIIDTKLVQPPKEEKYYEVRAKAEGNPLPLDFLTRDEQVYKEAVTFEGTDHKVALTWRKGRRGEAVVRILQQIALDEA